jgi:hypothetical protein
LVLVRLAFALIVPLGSAPDEGSHFIKAYASVRLQSGDTDHVPLPADPSDMDRLNQSLGAIYDMGDDGVNPTWGCNAMHPETPAACVDLNAITYLHRDALTPFGAFQPYLYVPLGVASLVLSDPDHAMLAMRLTVLLWTSIFGTAALAIIARRWGTHTLLATLVGTTPMLLYTQGTLGTTGIEAAAAFAMFVAALDVLWDQATARGTSVALFLASAISLLLCRPLSVLVAIVLAGVIGCILGWSRLRDRVRRSPSRWRIAAGAVLGACVVANLGWALASTDPYGGHPIGVMGSLGHYLLETSPHLWQMVVGVFEWIDTDLPFMAVVAAWFAIVIVLAGAFPDRDRRISRALVVLVAATIAYGYVIDFTVFSRVGGLVQGRHLLPLFALWTLVAALPAVGSSTSSSRAITRRLRWLTVVSGGVTGLAVLYVARREAVGIGGPLDFFGAAAYRPFAGWALPLGLAAIGVVVAFAVPVIAATPEDRAA